MLALLPAASPRCNNVLDAQLFCNEVSARASDLLFSPVIWNSAWARNLSVDWSMEYLKPLQDMFMQPDVLQTAKTVGLLGKRG